MSLQSETKQSIKKSLTASEIRLKQEIDAADAIVIGAGAGLSASAGFAYSGERFEKYFADFSKAYGFHDMYSGGFYPYETPEEYWAYWSRYVVLNRYQDAPKPVYEDLLKLIGDTNYFIITTNVDHCFQKAGFDKKRLFCTQGDYGLFQCATPCHHKTYDNEIVIKRMASEQRKQRIPSGLIPRCPVCGKPMTMNLRIDSRFVEDEEWHSAVKRYDDFIRQCENRHILFWELGVGYNTPGIIKYPFWQMAFHNSKSVYACLNSGEIDCPSGLKQQSICIREDIGTVLMRLLCQKGKEPFRK